MGFSRQEYLSQLPMLPPGIFLIQGSNLCPLYWQVVSSPLSLLGSQQKTGFCHLVAQSCPTLCDPVDCSTPGIPVLHHLPEFAQTHVHGVSDAVQPSCPLLSPSSLLTTIFGVSYTWILTLTCLATVSPKCFSRGTGSRGISSFLTKSPCPHETS